MRILKSESIGLVIDIQEKLFPHIFEKEALERNVNILTGGLNVLGVPVMLTEQYTRGLGFTIPSVKAILEEVKPVEKMSFSCCDDKDFSLTLASKGIKNVIISGIEAHVCVLQTCIDLLAGGYQPVVVEDCISSRKEKDKKTAIERMRAEGAIISSYESILFELTRESGTEVFKAVSRLVK